MNPTGSFDGGDQGLLNSFFANWAQSDNSRRLPFIYNTCSTACYSYLPAFKEWITAHFSCENSPHRFNSNVLLFSFSKRFGENVKILHFIGQLKPWLINFDPVAKKPNPPQEYKHLTEFLDLWWGIFVNQVHPKLATDMVSPINASNLRPLHSVSWDPLMLPLKTPFDWHSRIYLTDLLSPNYRIAFPNPINK